MLLGDHFATLPVNPFGRDLIVGDLHGQLEMLERGLDMVSFDPAVDRLIALGDLIDRGSGSQALLHMVETQPWFYSTLGNHEAMMLSSQIDWETRRLWDVNDNDWIDQINQEELAHCCRIADGFPMAMELPLRDGRTIGLIHAEVRVGCAWSDMRGIALHGYDAIDGESSTDSAAAIWGRRRVTAEAHMQFNRGAKRISDDRVRRLWAAVQPVNGIDLIISGHSVLKPALPRAISNFLFIDTGAYLPDGRLTLVDPLSMIYWQVGRSKNGLRAARRKATPLPKALRLPEAYKHRAKK